MATHPYQPRKPARMFFDCETLANPETCALMPDPVIEAPANYKDPVKIAEYIAEKAAAAKAAAIEKAALDPDYGKILSLGYATSYESIIHVRLLGEGFDRDEEGPNGEQISVHYERTEVDLLKEFWAVFKYCNGCAVGYNILGFDIPYLLRRSMAAGVKVLLFPNLAKFRTEPITDLMAILYNWGSDRYKSLKQVARIYKLVNDCPDVDGSKLASLTPDQLRAYQTSDVKLVMQLYQKMNGVYFSV